MHLRHTSEGEVHNPGLKMNAAPAVVEAFDSVHHYDASAAELPVALEPHTHIHSRLLPSIHNGHDRPFFVRRDPQYFDLALGLKRPTVCQGDVARLSSMQQQLQGAVAEWHSMLCCGQYQGAASAVQLFGASDEGISVINKPKNGLSLRVTSWNNNCV